MGVVNLAVLARVFLRTTTD